VTITRKNYHLLRESIREQKLPLWQQILLLIFLVLFINITNFLIVSIFDVDEHFASFVTYALLIFVPIFVFLAWLGFGPARMARRWRPNRPWSGRFDAWKPPMDDARRVEKE
jgi:uncharacterized membrane protein